jgi:hypothetical protein
MEDHSAMTVCRTCGSIYHPSFQFSECPHQREGPRAREGHLWVWYDHTAECYRPLTSRAGTRYLGPVSICLRWAHIPDEWEGTEQDDPYAIDADEYEVFPWPEPLPESPFPTIRM